MRWLNLAARFCCEVAAVSGIVWWGWPVATGAFVAAGQTVVAVVFAVAAVATALLVRRWPEPVTPRR